LNFKGVQTFWKNLIISLKFHLHMVFTKVNLVGDWKPGMTVSLGSNITKSVESIKILDHDRLAEASKKELKTGNT
jgi:hypothetical protein